MIRRIRFDRHHGGMDVANLELEGRISIALQRPLSGFAMYVNADLKGSYHDPLADQETRKDYGIRLRRAASDFGREAERAFLKQLVEMGHLVS